MKKYYSNIKYEEFYDTKRFGKVRVIGRKNRKLKVRFLDTGNEYWRLNHKVVNGDIVDSKRLSEEVTSRREEWRPFKEDFVNNSGETFSSFERRGKKVKIKFDLTGHTCEVYLDNARAGKVKDPYSVSVMGGGYLGEFDKSKTYWRQAKQLWNNMLKRCYDENLKGNYVGRVFVSSRWKCFANFLEDISSLKNFNLWLEGQTKGKTKYNLDKDKILDGNNVYSKDLCMFLTEFENKSIGKLNKILNSNGEFTKTL